MPGRDSRTRGLPDRTRAFILAALAAWVASALAGQTPSVLHIRVTLVDAANAAVPLPRHALLISDNPATSTPRRVVTGPDGTVDVRLRPGSYTVESDAPVTFGGKGYQWTETIAIEAGADRVLALTAANAEVGEAPATSSSSPSGLSPTPRENDAALLARWQDSVVAIWTPRARASGFVADAAGLVVTSYRATNGASGASVQFTPSVKVAARVLAADATRDVAVLWVDPAVTASLPAVPLGCPAPVTPSLARYQRVVSIGAPLRGPRELAVGEVTRAAPSNIVADFRLAPGSAGGPIFDASGDLAGLASIVPDEDERRRRDARIVPTAEACAVLDRAKAAMPVTERPGSTRLPVEPAQPFPVAALEAAVRNRADTSPARLSSSDFDIVWLTPVAIYGAQQRAQQARGGGAAAPQGRQIDATDFDDWSEYFADAPPVLVIRVTPKLTEGFWTKIARGAAYTQGMTLPPIRRFRPGFSRLRAYCGDTEVMPIHPFTLEQRVTETDAVREGLYVFAPQAFGPHCKSVRLGVYSEKEPDKEDARTVAPAVIERIWQDFAPFRALGVHGVPPDRHARRRLLLHAEAAQVPVEASQVLDE